MSATTVNGSDLVLWITEGATKVPIALSTGCTVSSSMTTRNTSSKDSGIYDESVVSKLSWSISSDALFTVDTGKNNYFYLFDKMSTRSLLTVTFGGCTLDANGIPVQPQTPRISTEQHLSGTVYITKLDLDAKAEENATMSIELTGTGALSVVDITV